MPERSGVVILSASPYSAYSLSLMHLLHRRDIQVKGVLVQRLVNPDRLLKEVRTSGFALLGKVFRKLILQRLGVGKKFQDGFSAYFSTLDEKPSSLQKLCEQNGAVYKVTRDFHSIESLKFIESANPALVAFTGGGIIRESLMKSSGLGVLNCHMGILPKYRGMDCSYWCALNRDYKNVGFTVHLMDAGVDTGPIAHRHYIDVHKLRDIDEAVFHIEYKMAPAMADVIEQSMEGIQHFKRQDINEGQQYYTMSPECLAIARRAFIRDVL